MMKRFLLKMPVGFCSVLLLVTAVAVPQASSQAPPETSPTQLRILSAVGNVQTSVNILQTSVDDLQTSVNDVQTAVNSLPTPGPGTRVPPTWDKVLPADDPGGACPNNSSRFSCVMAGAAVRDNETGLVWEQSPGPDLEFGRDWNGARLHCANKAVGGRKGWRLPSVPELASLVDPSVEPPGATLPPGHPFTNVQPIEYWSASSRTDTPLLAWFVRFDNGSVGASSKPLGFRVWCVRGAMNADQY